MFFTDEQISRLYKKDGHNVRKALDGMGIVHSDKRYRNRTDNLSSVLYDLMQYATRERVDFDTALSNAREAFAEDTKIE